MNFIIYFYPFLTRIKQINAHTCILTKPFHLCANDSYFTQSIYLIEKADKIPCAILEWSDTILELRDQVGILTLCRAILEWYRFPLLQNIYKHLIRGKLSKFSQLSFCQTLFFLNQSPSCMCSMCLHCIGKVSNCSIKSCGRS